MRIKSFGNPVASAATPSCVPIEGSDGVIYGTTSQGGPNDYGTVFKVSKDGSGLTILHQFSGAPNDGQTPLGGVIEGPDGALYGATSLGGSNNLGVVFRLTRDGGSFSILRNIAGSDGSNPMGSLLYGTDGMLYGTTLSSVFKLNLDGSGFSVLHGFAGSGDGLHPQFGVIEASDGDLYGTTAGGGSNNLGTVFRMDKSGGNYALLFNFSSTNVSNPQAGLLEASDGLLYGTTSSRGTNSYGAVFQLDKDGTNFNVIHTFWGTNSEGWYPQSALVEGNDGALYGTTTNGGLEAQGTIFKLNKDGSGYGVVHHFSWDNDDGRVPLAGLFKSTNGTFYGTTSLGGSADYGAVFRFDPVTTNCTVVASLSWTGGDGWSPQANVIEGSDGMLYGTTFGGGTNNYGTVFRVNKDGSDYTVLHSFAWTTDGAVPRSSVIEATNGELCGTAFDGGSNGLGTVFMLNKDGSGFNVLHHFSGLNGDGSRPQAALLQGSNGALYGTTTEGGSNDFGTVFTINLDGGGYTVLHSVPATNSFDLEPDTALIEASDGNLYGVAAGAFNNAYAGAIATNGLGSIYRISKDGSAFADVETLTNGVTQGQGLDAGLVEGSDGALYGTAYSGGAAGYGTVFKLNKDGSSFTVLRSFGSPRTTPYDAKYPSAGLLVGSNGLLYGTTSSGYGLSPFGNTNGTVFVISQDGSHYQVLRYFDSSPLAEDPSSSLSLASDGALYGTASAGGDAGGGTIFSLANPPSFTGIQMGDSGALLEFQGVSSRTYGIQASTNLTSALWQNIPGSATWTNGLFEFRDTNVTNSAAKFYRTVTE